MFILRSAFWLTLAYLAIGPKDVDLGAAAQGLSAEAVAAGQHFIVAEIMKTECTSIECVGGKAMLAAALPAVPSVEAPARASIEPVPFPRPRPAWMG
jgi:hypothetical protein